MMFRKFTYDFLTFITADSSPFNLQLISISWAIRQTSGTQTEGTCFLSFGWTGPFKISPYSDDCDSEFFGCYSLNLYFQPSPCVFCEPVLVFIRSSLLANMYFNQLMFAIWSGHSESPCAAWNLIKVIGKALTGVNLIMCIPLRLVCIFKHPQTDRHNKIPHFILRTCNVEIISMKGRYF